MLLKELKSYQLLKDYKVNLEPLSIFLTEESTKIKEAYIVSTWDKGMWVKKDKNSEQIYPLIFILSLDQTREHILNLEIVEETCQI